jgi:hypothetical protein
MNYVNRMLQPGEEIAYRTRLHPMAFVKPLVVTIALLVLANVVPEDYVPFVAAMLLVVCIPYAILVATSCILGDVAVTNRRVLLRTGPLRGQMNEVLLHKIRTVEASIGLAGAGRVRMDLAGGVLRSVSFVRNPAELADAIERARKRLQAQGR